MPTFQQQQYQQDLSMHAYSVVDPSIQKTCPIALLELLSRNVKETKITKIPILPEFSSFEALLCGFGVYQVSDSHRGASP